MIVNKAVYRRKKLIATFFLLVFAGETLIPAVSYALTSGPSQPEMKGFEPVSASNMVDPFTGDFSYTIPLLDVDGYPVTLNYRAGASPDDEASWVGYGWSLTPGALNRQLRGLPDDFDGTNGDVVQKEVNYKDHITKGINLKAKAELMGYPIKLGSVDLGVEYDNYRGIGTKIGINAGLSLSALMGTANNNNNDEIGINITGSSLDGASAKLNFDILTRRTDEYDSELSLKVAFPYNSRSGLQGMSLSTSFNPGECLKDQRPLMRMEGITSSFISFAAPTYTPTMPNPTSSVSYSGSVSAGAQFSALYAVPGTALSGYWGKTYIANADKIRNYGAFGFLYTDRAKKNDRALLDFNREKDIPYRKEVKYLPVPIPTNDLFMATSETDAGQYRISRNSHGVFADPYMESGGSSTSFGLEVGGGGYFDLGADLFFQSSSNRTGKWKKNNDFLPSGDFSSAATENTLNEKAYFKKIGEPVVLDIDYYRRLSGDSTVSVALSKSGTSISTQAAFSSRYGTTDIASLERTKREVRNQPISYLTAAEAGSHALDKKIVDYPENTLVLGSCNTSSINLINRLGSYRKANHFSEITTTASDGKRCIYGIPVYNTYFEEVSFSITGDTSLRSTGIINYSGSPKAVAAASNSPDKHYTRQVTSAYTTSYLLTGVLSADYVDVKGDGITDDDMGSAVKFNYHKLPYEYKWRTPYGSKNNPLHPSIISKANYNEGMLSDTRDDRASYTYGRKEVWYMHSIESKTMIALFITEDRNDGLGVMDEGGNSHSQNKLKRLKEIRLYSKSDVYANKNSDNTVDLTKLTPVKAVHFEYTYSLMQGLPNTGTDEGKLTLKKVYFTYGKSNIGIVHPYAFEYNNDSTVLSSFNHRMYDRWGVYKDKAANPGGMNNSEFPYTIQDKNISDEFVARWQLKKIHLPTGGIISVELEADDYAYVQNKRAMQMFRITGVGTGGSAGSGVNLVNASEVFVDIPEPVGSVADFLYRYLDGEKYLFFKCFLDLDSRGHYEYVPGYAKIQSVRLVNSSRVAITLEKEKVEGIRENEGKVNPIAFAGWQFIRTNLPKYAYPGYDNLEQDGSDLLKALKSLITAVSSLTELLPNYYGRKAKGEGFSNKIDLNKSFVRLQSPTFKKTGGGLRVKKIMISDAWQELSGVSDAKTAEYTQLYNYTKTIKDNKGDDITISSGVASYEPILGGEENPFHQPVFYRQDVVLQLDNYYYIEEPFCEGLYPAPSVGYSRVSVKSVGSGETESRTGEVISEFYTAKEYPTRVDVMSLEARNAGSSKLLAIFTSRIVQNVGLSQGYRIENNDMHGKPRSVAVFNKAGVKISSTEYFYKTLNPDEENGQLDNRVKLLMPDATVTDGVIGKEIEMYTDMRESVSDNDGTKVYGSGGLAAFFWFPIPFFIPGVGFNSELRTYRSSATIKVINNFAVLDKVRKMENGSVITTENVLWDGRTGDVLMTRTQNEYGDPVYNLSVPAHWAYASMGQAYQNEGTYITGLTTGANGEVANSSLAALMQPGDEIADLNTGKRYWAIYTLNRFALIGRDGKALSSGIINHAKIIRSGYRNILSTPLCSYVSLKNPIVGNKLDVTAATKVLAMDAASYTEDWKVPRAVCTVCPEGFALLPDGVTCAKDTAVNYAGGYGEECGTICEGDHHSDYSAYGTLIYPSGYDTTGEGATPMAVTGNSFWTRSATDCASCQVLLNSQKAPGVVNMKVTQEAGATGTQTFKLPQRQSGNSGTATAKKGALVPLSKNGSIRLTSSSQLNMDSLNAYNQQVGLNSTRLKSTPVGTAGNLTKKVNPAPKTNATTKTNSANKVMLNSEPPPSPCANTPGARSNTSHCGPLERTGVWSCEGTGAPYNKWIGFVRQIYVPETRTYYVGLAADNYFRLVVDDTLRVSKLQTDQANFRYWFIYPVTLSAGYHILRMEASNQGGPATFGVEVYNNTAEEISTATGYCDLNMIFSTRDMLGQEFSSGYALPCPSGYNLVSTDTGYACRITEPVSFVYNPYVAGHKGNWRAQTSYAYHTNRENITSDPAVTGSTNIRYAGAYIDVSPFWQYQSGSWVKTSTGNSSKWVQKNEGTAFNGKGASIEEKDPLNRYSSVLMGYLDSRPVAVASNAKYSELVYDGFEDYSFLLDCNSAICSYSHFNIRHALGGNISIDNNTAHSGNSSLKLSSPLSVTQSTMQNMLFNSQYAVNNTTGLFELNNSNSWAHGFTPETGKKYLLSLWVKDNAPRNASTATAIKVNGASIINTSQKWPIVEGWKRVEVSFVMPAANLFTLEIVPSGETWVDDIRIIPFDAQMKSYAYDALSQRLMAEMDENNFATFYEYDSEGTLVRVKKETEKGIVTIKETRSSYRRKTE